MPSTRDSILALDHSSNRHIGPWRDCVVGSTLTQITNELKSAFDWLSAKAGEHGIQGPIIVTGWSAGGHLTSFILYHPKVTARLAISGVGPRGSPPVNDQ